MSESGLPKVPAKPTPLPGQSQRTPQPEEQTARVGKLPPDLQAIDRSIRLRGKVVETIRDARTQETIVTIRTPRGDVEVHVPPDETPPREGQEVEVEIRANPRGGEPERAVIRPEQPATPPISSTPAPRPEDAPQPRPAQTPVEVVVRPQDPARPPAAPPADMPDLPPWPEPGSVVRLSPLPPREAASVVTPDPAEIILSNVAQPTQHAAQIIADDAVQDILKQALNIRPETVVLPSKMVILSPDIPVTLAPPVFGESKQTATLIVPETSAPLKPQLLQTGLPAPGAAITTTPEILTPGVILSTRAQSIDVRIAATLPPKLELVAPGEKPQKPGTIADLQNIPIILRNQKPEMVSGVITGTTKEGLPVLTTVLPGAELPQSFILQAPLQTLAAPLTPGTQIQFTPQLLPGAPGQMAIAAAALPPFSYFLTPEPWPAMEEIYNALARLAPAAAQALSNVAPSPANPAQMTPAALFFIAAIRGGDMTGWLGDKAIEALKRGGREGLLSRITQEGSLISRMASEPVSQEWRAMPLPMYWQGEFHKIALYYKRDEHNKDQPNQQGGQVRFVFDLSLSQMGKVQLDGLFRGKRLDLIVRTEQHFSQAVQMDMRATYAKALRETSVTGELSFQNKPEQWVMITPEQQNFGASA